MNERFRNSVTQVKSHPGADCGSDHNTIVATVRVIIRKRMRKKSQPKLKTDLLRSENEYRQKFRQQVSARIHDMVRTDEIETRYT